jgi:protein-disulfide isomerase
LNEAERPRGRRWVPIIGLSLVAAGVLTAIVFISVGEEGSVPPVSGSDTVQRLFGGIDQDEDTLGDPDAPVTVTVFNDLQCIPCADWQLETIPPLIEGPVRRGDAKLEFRHRSIGSRVVTEAALGAEAAGEQGFEWQFIHLVFLNLDQVEISGTDDAQSQQFLERVAAAVPSPELNEGRWESDRESDEYISAVESDDLEAIEFEVASPAVVVSGPGGEVVLREEPSFEQIEDAVAEVR